MKISVLLHVSILVGLLLSCKKNIDFSEIHTGQKAEGSVTTKQLSSANTYYVSPSGDDTNDGLSPATAWKTLAKVDSTDFLPGDNILFEGGKTFTGMLYIKSSGASGMPVRFANYGAGRAIINAGTGTGIYVYNASYITLDSFIVTGGWNAATQSGNDASGVLFYTDIPGAAQLGEVELRYSEVKGFAQSGVRFLSWPDDGSQTGYSKIRVIGSYIHDNGACGISTLGPSAGAGSTAYAFPNVYIGYNKVYNNLGVKANTSNHTGNGILIADASGGTIEFNVAYNNGWNSMSPSGGPAGIWCYDSRNLVFQFNESHHNGTGAGKPDGDGFDLDGGAVNCKMQYNYSHDNYGAGFLVWEYGNTRVKNSGNIIRYNISQNDNTSNNNTVYGGVSIGPGCNNNLVYNNTFWSVKGSSIFVTGGTGNKFYNNIFATQGTAPCIVSTSGGFFLNNNYYNPAGFRVKYAGSIYTSLTNFRFTGNEKYNGVAKGYNVNPQLTSPGTAGNINNGTANNITNYLPLAGSPMINTAFNLTTLGLNVGTKDFRRKTIPYGGGYDIGACEWR